MIKSLWLAEAIRLIEKESGRFADGEANRQAKMATGSLSDRIMIRAAVIAKQNGLLAALDLLLHAIKFSLAILLIIAMAMGVTLALGVLNQNPVNLYFALISLLGLHFITLLIWLFSSLCLPSGSGSLFIYCWLYLAKKLSQKQTIKQLIPAFITLFGHRIRWLVGFIVNLLWSVILSTALVVLLILFSTKYYSFEWKTTLLSSDNVITVTHYLGALPALLGFSMPSDAIIRVSEQAVNASDVRSAWAIWLLGVFVVYGVLVRLTLMVFCGIKWWQSCRQIQLNPNQSDYQLLRHDIEPITKQIVDYDTIGRSAEDLTFRKTVFNNQSSQHSASPEHHAFLVAIDIEEQWTPPVNVPFLGFLNTGAEREQILDYLQVNPVQKLLIAIDTDRAPDRGIVNFITVLFQKAAQSRFWFINQGKQLKNWQALALPLADPSWLNSVDLAQHPNDERSHITPPQGGN